MIYPKLSDGTIDWCAMCKHKGSDFFDLCCMCEYGEKEDDPPTLYEPKQQTNGDRIRSMSDEELAEFMRVAGGCGPTFDSEYCQGRKQCGGKNECWLDWLRQEAKDD